MHGADEDDLTPTEMAALPERARQWVDEPDLPTGDKDHDADLRAATHFARGVLMLARECARTERLRIEEKVYADVAQEENEQLRDERDVLTTRRDELLALVASISQTVPLESEVTGALEQRGALLAEIGTLRALAVHRLQLAEDCGERRDAERERDALRLSLQDVADLRALVSWFARGYSDGGHHAENGIAVVRRLIAASCTSKEDGK